MKEVELKSLSGRIEWEDWVGGLSGRIEWED